MSRKMLLGDPPPIPVTTYDVKHPDALPIRLPTRFSPPDAADSPFVRLGIRSAFPDEHGCRQTGSLVLRTGTPVPPERRVDDSDGISVISPDGAALPGPAEGRSIRHAPGDGRTRTFAVLRIHPT